MGTKIKGGMWCDYCQRPVAGQKSTHKLAKIALAVFTPAAMGPGKYHCPTCGQPVRPI